MLILSRKEGESILVGKDIKISVLELNKSFVKFGIDAPEEMIILRSELETAVKTSNTKANKQVPDEILKSLRKRFED